MNRLDYVLINIKDNKKNLKISKMVIKPLNWRKTDNTMAKKKSKTKQKIRRMIHKALFRQLPYWAIWTPSKSEMNEGSTDG